MTRIIRYVLPCLWVNCIHNFCSPAPKHGCGEAQTDPCCGNRGAKQVQEERYANVLREITARVSLIFTTARQQGLLINGAIGLQVIVGAITTGVAAASKNVPSSPPYYPQAPSVDTLIDRSGLPLLSLVACPPRWLPILPKQEDPVNRNFPTFDRGS